ncbi:MAG: hypothetical protein H6567_13215 [Lewinellaceae bacterium]|nr:hypothetical protein [Lewinellaceae bacterium]
MENLKESRISGILSIVIFLLMGCQSKELDYCKMLELDQSHVCMDTTDMIKFQAERTIRHELIKNNFKELIEYADKNRFPEMGKLDVSGIDSCRNWAVFITCFHIGQIEPQLFFEEKTIEVLTREIEKGNLESSSLFTSFREGFRNHEFCKSQEEIIQSTLEKWEININELPEVRYKKCSM